MGTQICRPGSRCRQTRQQMQVAYHGAREIVAELATLRDQRCTIFVQPCSGSGCLLLDRSSLGPALAHRHVPGTAH